MRPTKALGGKKYPWGGAFPPPGPVAFDRPSEANLTDVESHPIDRTKSGIADLFGSVREWTADCYDRNSGGLCNSFPCIDPRAPETTDCERVVRGGDYESSAKQLATFVISSAAGADRVTGIRCASTP